MPAFRVIKPVGHQTPAIATAPLKVQQQQGSSAGGGGKLGGGGEQHQHSKVDERFHHLLAAL
jgi:hypothetical protein